MQPESPVDYEALHTCLTCRVRLTLATLPVVDGWVVGTRCECRNRSGGPLHYSTESPSAHPTFDSAEDHRKTLLGETTWV